MIRKAGFLPKKISPYMKVSKRNANLSNPKHIG